VERLTGQEKGLVLGLLAVIVVGIGLIVWRHTDGGAATGAVSGRTAEAPQGPAVAEPRVEYPPGPPATITVDVSGAVWRPGVYELPAGSRLGDILARAMPFEDADLDAVNRAAQLRDGDKVVIPRRADAARHAATVGLAESHPRVVDINSASERELEFLPGIGPSRAAAIVRYRRANGPFTSVDALERVPGIGSGIVDGLRQFASVAGVPPESPEPPGLPEIPPPPPPPGGDR